MVNHLYRASGGAYETPDDIIKDITEHLNYKMDGDDYEFDFHFCGKKVSFGKASNGAPSLGTFDYVNGFAESFNLVFRSKDNNEIVGVYRIFVENSAGAMSSGVEHYFYTKWLAFNGRDDFREGGSEIHDYTKPYYKDEIRERLHSDLNWFLNNYYPSFTNDRWVLNETNGELPSPPEEIKINPIA